MIPSGVFSYLDTSAYLAILLGERPAKGPTNILAKRRLCTSVLLLVEEERNFIRLSRERQLSTDDYHACMERLNTDFRRGFNCHFSERSAGCDIT